MVDNDDLEGKTTQWFSHPYNFWTKKSHNCPQCHFQVGLLLLLHLKNRIDKIKGTPILKLAVIKKSQVIKFQKFSHLLQEPPGASMSLQDPPETSRNLQNHMYTYIQKPKEPQGGTPRYLKEPQIFDHTEPQGTPRDPKEPKIIQILKVINF